MKIQVTCEKDDAYFKTSEGNYPYEIGLLDNTSHTIIEASLDLPTFKKLMVDIHRRVKITEMIQWVWTPSNVIKLNEIDNSIIGLTNATKAAWLAEPDGDTKDDLLKRYNALTGIEINWLG